MQKSQERETQLWRRGVVHVSVTRSNNMEECDESANITDNDHDEAEQRIFPYAALKNINFNTLYTFPPKQFSC